MDCLIHDGNYILGGYSGWRSYLMQQLRTCVHQSGYLLILLQDMQGSKPCLFFTICWKYVSPGLLIIIFCITFVQNMIQAPSYTVYIGCNDVSAATARENEILIKQI